MSPEITKGLLVLGILLLVCCVAEELWDSWFDVGNDDEDNQP